MLLMQNVKHPGSIDLERNTSGYGHGRGRSPRSCCRHRLFAKKVSSGKHRYRGLFAPLGDYGELCPATLEIKHRICRVSLGKESLLCRETKDASSRSFSLKKMNGIKGFFRCCCHRNDLIPHAARVQTSFIMTANSGGVLACRCMASHGRISQHSTAMSRSLINSGLFGDRTGKEAIARNRGVLLLHEAMGKYSTPVGASRALSVVH